MTNGESSGLSAGKLSHVPDASNGVVDRFSQSAFADEPYFARARLLTPGLGEWRDREK